MLEAQSSETRNAARGSFVIRFNVGDLAGATKYLESQGVDLVTHDFDWVRLLYLLTQTETDANLRRLPCGSEALSQGVASIRT